MTNLVKLVEGSNKMRTENRQPDLAMEAFVILLTEVLSVMHRSDNLGTS